MSNVARSRSKGRLSRVAGNPLAAIGFCIVAALVALALLVPVLPLLPPDMTHPAERLARPFDGAHYLGTDQLGRDLLSRVLWGMRLSLAAGVSGTVFAALAGSSIGMLAGYFGGLVDTLLMRAIDMLMAFPYVLLAIAIVAALGPGLFNALIAVALVNVPFFARNVRGAVASIARAEFIDAARLSGKGDVSILGTELLPNVAPMIVIAASATVGWMILETAGLSFLGLGSQPPQADLGSMLGEGRKILLAAPHVSIVPGAVIFLLVIGANLLGDGIRDALDPRLRGGAFARPSLRTSIKRRKVPGPSPGADDVLEVADLRTEFRTADGIARAVNGVSFTIGSGECLGLVGESGSGKSVTGLSLLALVQSPPGLIAGGSVFFHGDDVLAYDDAKLRELRGGRAAYIFQDPQSTLHPLFRIGDQVAEAVRAHGKAGRREAWDKAVKLLETVRIPNARRRAGAFPHELSGGMRQRVVIAMALANGPELLIADEPTTSLDVTVQAQVLALLAELRARSGAAVLFITHDFAVASEVCDRIAVMYAGEIVEIGPTREVLENPAHPYTRKLIDCVPVPGRRSFESIRGISPSPKRLPEGCAFAERCDRASAQCRARPIAMREPAGNHGVRCLHPHGTAP